MAAAKPIIALMYDFDKTLCTKDMQEYTFIPHLGMEASEFWEQVGVLAETQHMDQILAYMYFMVRKAEESGQAIRRKDLVQMGRFIEFFPGVESWFDRINQYGTEKHVQIEHYIISSGLKEIIEGSGIQGAFKEIFACEFHYHESGIADWPLLAVNYTGKTQFLFRINKGILEISNDVSLNTYIPEDERPVPFRNMIYFGDGLTDVPCMKLVRLNGGQSIAVYQRKEEAENLLRFHRVNFIAPADYTQGGELEQLVKSIISQMAETDALIRKTQAQREELGSI